MNTLTLKNALLKAPVIHDSGLYTTHAIGDTTRLALFDVLMALEEIDTIVDQTPVDDRLDEQVNEILSKFVL